MHEFYRYALNAKLGYRLFFIRLPYIIDIIVPVIFIKQYSNSSAYNAASEKLFK
jgi:hypothetical protein